MIKHASQQEREILSINFPIAPEVTARMTTVLSEKEVESTEGEHFSFLNEVLKTYFFTFTGGKTDIGGGWEKISMTWLASLNALHNCFGNPHHQQLPPSLTEATTTTNTLLSGLS